MLNHLATTFLGVILFFEDVLLSDNIILSNKFVY